MLSNINLMLTLCRSYRSLPVCSVMPSYFLVADTNAAHLCMYGPWWLYGNASPNYALIEVYHWMVRYRLGTVIGQPIARVPHTYIVYIRPGIYMPISTRFHFIGCRGALFKFEPAGKRNRDELLLAGKGFQTCDQINLWSCRRCLLLRHY